MSNSKSKARMDPDEDKLNEANSRALGAIEALRIARQEVRRDEAGL
jgi:hypothetical protein